MIFYELFENECLNLFYFQLLFPHIPMLSTVFNSIGCYLLPFGAVLLWLLYESRKSKAFLLVGLVLLSMVCMFFQEACSPSREYPWDRMMASAFPLSAGLYSVRVSLRLHSGLPEGVEGNRFFCSWRNEPGIRICKCLLSGGAAGRVFVPFHHFSEIQKSPSLDQKMSQGPCRRGYSGNLHDQYCQRHSVSSSGEFYM